jgi:hypothetical protein
MEMIAIESTPRVVLKVKYTNIPRGGQTAPVSLVDIGKGTFIHLRKKSQDHGLMAWNFTVWAGRKGDFL